MSDKVNVMSSHAYSLGGYPPFSDEIKEYSLHDQIVNARYSFPQAYWEGVSLQGIVHLIRHCITMLL